MDGSAVLVSSKDKKLEHDDEWWARVRREYVEKNDLLLSSGEWMYTAPYDFFRTIFPKGFLEQQGVMIDWHEPGGGKPNAIVMQITHETKEVVTPSGSKREKRIVRRMTLTDDFSLEDMEKLYCGSLERNEPTFCSPISYFGKQRIAANARFFHAFVVDLDGVGPQELKNILKQIGNSRDPKLPKWTSLPQPTFIVNSGTGLHLYYVLEQPIPLIPRFIPFLQSVKERLTDYVWRDTTSFLEEKQFQGIYQSFRMPGTTTKLNGAEEGSKQSMPYEAVAFAFNGPDGDPWRCSLDYLIGYVGMKDNGKAYDELMELMKTAGKTPLEKAKKLWPEWYQRRIVEEQPPGRWTNKRALYDWWLRQIAEGASDHHRYWCLNVLAAYADKCGVPYEELEEDALALVPFLDSLTERPDNHFTDEHALAAISQYGDGVIHKLSLTRIERRTGITIPRNKRTSLHRGRSAHMKRVNKIIELDVSDGAKDPRYHGGAPTKCDMIRAYAIEHPDANHSEIARALGVSRPTVIKWLKDGWQKEWEHQSAWADAKIVLRRDDDGEWLIAKLDGHTELEGRPLPRPQWENSQNCE